MTEPLIPIPLPSPMEAIQAVAVVVAAIGTVMVGPPLIQRVRQHAYDKASAAEAMRLVIASPVGSSPDQDLAIELIGAVHPRQRRGFDRWRVGWPSADLSVAWRNGELAWEVIANRQLAAQVEHAVRALYPAAEVALDRPANRAASAVAVAHFAASSAWPLGEASTLAGRPLNRLAAALEHAPRDAEVRLRLAIRPVPHETWRRQVAPPSSTAPTMRQIIVNAVIDGLLFRPNAREATSRAAPTLSAEEREAQERKRRGVVGFDVGLALEVAGIERDRAEALLWRLTDFTHPLGDGRQEIRWKIHRGGVANPRRSRLADWELAQLWYLPDASFDRAGFVRELPLAAPRPPSVGAQEPGLAVAGTRDRPLAIPLSTLPKHLAVLGATGSGKSTLLQNLALAAMEAGIGATVIDPHGDLARDILCRIPHNARDRVHVLRLADGDHPRAFNFLERRQRRQEQLVASEFVYLLEDLWPRFCGPKMQHYLRHALLTLLADERPQTILELVRVLTDDRFREPYLKRVGDPMVRSFWATQWPGGAERERDASIKAVLNKLGAFVTYDSIRGGGWPGEVDHPATRADGSRRRAAGRSVGRGWRQRLPLWRHAGQPLLR